MPDEPRLQQLLDELIDSNCTPEDVCRSCPELLSEVRERWDRMRRLEGELDAMFPTARDAATPLVAPRDNTVLPNIPGYTMEVVLGRGGMGIVFRARHLKLNRVVALKMMLSGALASPEERERFQREAEAVAALRHASIVQIYDVGEHEGRAYFTMEFIEGGSLAQLLVGSPRTPRQAAKLLATVAAAVQVAHDGGILHRDLKPANILLTSDGAPKITDFGLARRLDSAVGLTMTGTALGTPSYMAPEQARGSTAALGIGVDVYALGAILYELLTGQPPFRAETHAQTVQQVIIQDPVPPSRKNGRVPRDLEIICLKCLHKEPRSRYASASALADDLNRFLHGEAIAARPEGRMEKLARRIRRRPGSSAGLAVGTLVVVAFLSREAWLISERTAARQKAESEQSATERFVERDLTEMADLLKKSSLPAAQAAMERAKGRLGDRGPDHLHARLDQGDRELKLADRLDAIRLDLAAAIGGKLNYAKCDQDYEDAFRGAGLGTVHDDAGAVADRIRQSNIANLLVSTLDHWSIMAQGQPRKDWVLEVARRSDHDPTGWRDRARDPAIRTKLPALFKLIETAPVGDHSASLLLALYFHLPTTDRQTILFLERVQRAHPDDFWINLMLGTEKLSRRENADATCYFRVATALRPDVLIGHNNLGVALARDDSPDQIALAIEHYRRAEEIDPTFVGVHSNLARALSRLGRHDEALAEAQITLRLEPDSAIFASYVGMCFEAKGRFVEAEAALRRALTLEPGNRDIQYDIRYFLLRRGRLDEALAIWKLVIDTNPAEHGAWYGYAELCLFLGREDEYRRARHCLLAKFEHTTSLSEAERNSRTCLLLPASGDELNMAVSLAQRVVADEPAKLTAFYPFFLFVHGLAEYRQGLFDQAIATMKGEASRVLGPAPRLVLAMALHKKSKTAEARKMLAAAVVSHDWRSTRVKDQDDWIFHVLRREAEGMILPNLPKFLEGTHEPEDNDERLALLGVCQFTNRTRALARLYADAFAGDPSLAENLAGRYRFKAACAAALAGSGLGLDAAVLSEADREHWRWQARQWLRADLDAAGKLLNADPTRYKADVQSLVTQMRNDPDLAEIRDAAKLTRFSAEEQKDCLALWAEVDALLNRAGRAK
jgi:tetratricopeptide (TPR) repeat protein/tRNA A-37 threonylcarbamoyl transferase component Bud32